VSSFLQAITATSPVALLLDDLHWADISSLRLFQYLTRYTRASPILLLGTYRDVESTWNHLLEQVLLDLNRERLVERIALRRLDSSGTAALLQAKLDEPNVSAELAELVHRSAEGNPFFTEELLRTLVENGGLYQRNGHWAWKAISELGVPETVRSAIVRRFSHLGERTQKSVQQASVLGQTFHFDDLRRMTGQQEDELEGALDEGLRAGLIRMVAGDDYSFNHALTQQALYAELSPRRRAGLHLAAADAIEGEEGGTRQRRAAELARHFLHAHAAERALPYALLAGDQAQAMFAHAEAERQYRTALELAQEVGDAVRQAEALEKLSRTLTHMVRYDEALAMLERAAETYRAAGDLEGEGGVTADIGWIYRAQGRPDERLTRLRPMAEALETRGPSRSLARVHLMMSNIDLTAGDYDRGLAELERAAEVARAVKDDELLTMAERFRMSTLRWVGRADGVLEGMAGVLPVAEAEQDPIFLVQALNSASLASQFRGEFVKSKEYAERGLEIARRTGLPLDLAWTLNRVGCVATFMGDWKEAHAYFEEALHIVRAHGTTAMSPYPLMDLGNLLAGEGQWETAARYLDEAIALTEEMNDLLTLRWAQLHRAILNIVQEDPRAAITRLTPLLDRPGFEEFPVTPFLWVLAWAHLELGEEARAETLVLDSLRRARAQDNVLDLPPALRVQGMVLARQRRWEEAQRAFEEALSLTHAMSFPPAEAAILRDYGKMWAARGDRTRARQRLAEALAIFRRLGARIDVERTERALADLAGRRFTAIPE
jgi:tetratricopeptide (TPR) repeat protein